MAIAPRAGDSPAPRKAVPKRHAAAPKKNGRPSSYIEAAVAEICRRVVEGQSLRTICKAPGMPDKQTIANWRRAHPEFDKRYQDARCDQADMHVEEMLDVARQASQAKTSEEAQGYRLLVDTLKWRASKMKPRSYGAVQGHPSRRLATLSNLHLPSSSPPGTSPAPSTAMSSPGSRTPCKRAATAHPACLQRSARPKTAARSTKPEPLLKMPGG
jgi:hypothetical protein